MPVERYAATNSAFWRFWASPQRCIWTHRREREIRPGKLYRLSIQGFAYPFVSDKLPQISGSGNSDDHTAEKRASQRSFSRKSASAEGKNGNTDFTPAAYRVTSQLPCRRSYMRLGSVFPQPPSKWANRKWDFWLSSIRERKKASEARRIR
jgi:hypothetical protein